MPTRASEQNFIKNSLRIFNDAEASKLWDYMDGVRKEVAREEEEAKSEKEKEKEKAAAMAIPSPADESAGKENVGVEGEIPRRKPKKGMDLEGHALSRGFTSNSISVRAVGDFALQETKITPTQYFTQYKQIVDSTASW